VITLDASVLIAHLSPRDPHHPRATAYLRAAVERGFLIHSLNLAEVLVGGARIGREREMLADLESIGVRVADRPAQEALRLAVLRARTGLKLPDCCALDTALAHGTALATFDGALAKAAREHHLTVAPEPN